jgi:hypothetical protein
MPKNFLTPDEARALLQLVDQQNAELRAKAPPGCADLYAGLFPPLGDEDWRRYLEKALLGELRHPCSLPPLEHQMPRSRDDRHD